MQNVLNATAFDLLEGEACHCILFLFIQWVCVQVGANLSVYFVTQVADCIADMRLWKVHIGARRPVRVLTSV